MLEVPQSGLVAHFDSKGAMVWLDGEPLAPSRMSATEFVDLLRTRMGEPRLAEFASTEINRFTREFLPALADLARIVPKEK